MTSSARREGTPAWAPDHRRIAFVGGNRTLVWLDTITGIRHRVTLVPPRFEGIDAGIAGLRSPDGRRVVFSTTTLTGEHRHRPRSARSLRRRGRCGATLGAART